MAMAVCCFAVASCQDDTFRGFGFEEVGDMEVTFTVDMPPLSAANMTSRGTAGDAIKDFDPATLYIYIYNEDGTSLLDRLGYNDLDDFKYTANGNTDRPSYPYNSSSKYTTSQGEASTPRATFKFKNNPFESSKKYQIYVTANVEVPENAYKTADDLKAYPVYWNNDPAKTASNNQMFGMFALSDESVDGEIISFIGASSFHLHAWLVRCASKVTISFDTTELNDNTWIYLHNVRIHNVPKRCRLGSRNTATEEEGNDVEDDGDMILYAQEGSDYANAANEFSSWPTLTRGTKYYPMTESDSQDHPENHAVHSETAEALYFYENLQGTGKDKSQIDSDKEGGTPDGEVSWPNGVDPNDDKYRDEKPLGTYIEVEAYYRSTTKGNEGMGTIKYRFMLGMDAFKDYNAYRNHHFKLIMAFKGNANDVDWHIEYISNDDNPIYVPNPFYISYLYGESVDIPITVNGKLAEGSKITAEIVENNWKPMDAPSTVYWNGPVKSGANENFDGPWHGFLSLRPTNAIKNPAGLPEVPNSDAIGREHTLNNIWTGLYQNNAGAYLMSYWYGGSDNMPEIEGVTKSDLYSSMQIENNEQMHVPPQGYREYETTNTNGKTTDYTKDNIDEYEITEVTNNGKTKTHIYLPLYTRALFMVKATGFSGANPYFFYQRKAVVKITCTIVNENGEKKKYSKLCDVIQVRRIINPCGIYREAGNNKSFTVTLSFRTSEKATTFMPFASDGKWSAEIESGDAGFITLNGQQKVFGRTGEFIKFQVHFVPAENRNKNRYAVILVKYHDYTCKHRILVRQGYSPDQMVDQNSLTGETPVAWHCFNLRGGEREADSPLEAGSLFRFGNLDWGIDASNNTTDQVNQAPNEEFDLVGKDGEISGKSLWGNLNFETCNVEKFNTTNLTFKNYITLKDSLGNVTNSGKNTRLAKFNEWKILREHSDIVYTYGICYDDNSSGTSMTADNAFNYSVFNPEKEGSGMRGIFLYNSKDARNMFLPVGASGHGRRNRGGSGDNYAAPGTLRYASRAVYMRQGLVEYTPMFWNIKDNIGAIYWGYPESFSPNLQNVWSNKEPITCFTAWDINMSTYDFNQFGTNAYTGSDSDAAFIRLVDEQ